MQPDLLEELFFSGLIGSVQIDSVIPYILNMQVRCWSGILMLISLSRNAVGWVRCVTVLEFWFLFNFLVMQLAEYGGMEESEEPIETEFEAVKEEIQ